MKKPFALLSAVVLMLVRLWLRRPILRTAAWI